ncbi:MAG: PDZ domain-containing protein, partial [Pseudomonadota bacterium]
GVTEDGPAAKAKIEAGDVIIKFDGNPVEEMRELPRMVAETAIGKEVEVVVLRKGEEVTINVILERLEESTPTQASVTEDEEPAEEPAAKSEVLGMMLAEIDDELREQFSIDADVTGVVVTEVLPDTSAAEKRITAGDVIKEVAQEPVETPADVASEIDRLKDDGRRSALLLLSNPTGDVRFVPVRIEDE